MMCGEGNEQQEQMTSEAAKSLVSIANALIRMEKGREKKKAVSTRQKKCREKMSSAVSTAAAPEMGCGSLNIPLTLSSQVFSTP